MWEIIIVELMDLLKFVGPFILGALASGITAYAIQAGKNYATKEDIEEITRKTDDVLQLNREILEGIKFKNQLKLAALEKRLEKAQEAFALWRRVRILVHNSEEIRKVVRECESWYDNNCLYLTAEAKSAFWNSFQAASLHRELIEGLKLDKSEKYSKEIRANWKMIMEAGAIIAESVDLPPTTDEQKIPELDLKKMSESIEKA